MSSQTNPLGISLSLVSLWHSLFSSKTAIRLDADGNNSSVLMHSGNTPLMYIDKYANVGINTVSPGSQLEVASDNGACLRLRYGSTSVVADVTINSSGTLSLNSSNSELNTNATLDIINHNGTTTGLKLNGVLVQATAAQLGYVSVIPGTASAGKALVKLSQ